MKKKFLMLFVLLCFSPLFVSATTMQQYQENPNQNGTSGNWGGNEANLIDGNWVTSATAAADAWLYINYTKPLNALNSTLWQIKDGANFFNVSMHPNCWQNSPDKLIFRVNATTLPKLRYYCSNTTHWFEVKDYNTAQLDEEGIWWTIADYTLSNCSNDDGENYSRALFIKFLDEQTGLEISPFFATTFFMEGFNQSFQQTSNNFSLCFQNYFTLDLSQMISLTSLTSYDTETFYINNIELSNITQNYTIYLTNATDSTDVTITCQDTTGDIQEYVYIYVYNYDPGTNTYVLWEVIKTNEMGQALAHLILNSNYYRFIITDRTNKVLLISETTTINQATVTLEINLIGSGIELYKEILDLDYSFYFDNVTGTVHFNWANPTNSDSVICIRTEKIGGYSNTMLNLSCQTGSTGYMNYTISDFLTTNNTYISSAYLQGSFHPFANLDIGEYKPWINWAKMGSFTASWVVITLALVGLQTPSMVIMLAMVGFAVSGVLMNLISIEWTVFIAIALLGVFLIVRMKQ